MQRTRLTPNQMVGRNVRKLREMVGYTQESLRQMLAQEGIDWSRPTVAQMELGNRPLSIDELFALAQVLHVAPDHLLYAVDGTEVQCGSSVLPAADLNERLWDHDYRGAGVHGLSKRRAYLDGLPSEEMGEDDIEAIRTRRAEQRGQRVTKEARERAKRTAPPPDDPIEVNPPEEPSKPKRSRARSKP